MAIKKEITQKPKYNSPTSFKSTNDFMSQFDEDGSLVEDYVDMEPADWIHSGHYLFNAHISGSLLKGVPTGKSITIAGDPKTGKSYLVHNIFREAQKKGYFIREWETENAPDKERFKKQGVDPKQIRITQPETVSKIIVEMTKATETLLAAKKAKEILPKLLFAIDSVTVLNSQKQYDDANKGNDVTDQGTIAKEIKKLFNMMSARLGKLQIPWINTMHVYEKDMGNNYKVKTPSGGNGPLFLSSVVVMLRKKFLKDEETKTKYGVLVTSSIFESRYSQHHDVDLYINFERGMNEFFGLQEYVSWDVCGIEKGKMTDFVDLGYELFVLKKIVNMDNISEYSISLTDLTKMLSKPKQEFIGYSVEKMINDGYLNFQFSKSNEKILSFTSKILEKFENGKYKYKPEQIVVPNPGSSGWAVKHLNKTVTTNELLTAEVFTYEVLKAIDDKVIIPKFALSSMERKEDEEQKIINVIVDTNMTAEEI